MQGKNAAEDFERRWGGMEKACDICGGKMENGRCRNCGACVTCD